MTPPLMYVRTDLWHPAAGRHGRRTEHRVPGHDDHSYDCRVGPRGEDGRCHAARLGLVQVCVGHPGASLAFTRVCALPQLMAEMPHRC